MAEFSTSLPLPIVRDAIVKILAKAGVTVPDGKLELNFFRPTSEHPEGGVQIRVSDAPDAPARTEPAE